MFMGSLLTLDEGIWTMTSVLGRLFTKRKPDQQTAAAAWGQLVRDVANANIDVAKVDKRLRAAGKSALELKEAVEASRKVGEYQAALQANDAEYERLEIEENQKVRNIQDEYSKKRGRLRCEEKMLDYRFMSAANDLLFLSNQLEPTEVQSQLDLLEEQERSFPPDDATAAETPFGF
jgi:hypothetical protein